ncbi:hypothetical protein [Homoserinibacter sp. GY 40078]|uniref:hypothetical protein n=1 Tax=Homoserinibacter sp. GY 40078 TaxID=2603275 RepID=UPI0011CBE9C2|nr:hypothetical protein [Homoserinibacter sp. GY 40078]TXK17020.1 hypothetical protein FVQ89_09040 [Homoserinibacter sp. GY 40078]
MTDAPTRTFLPSWSVFHRRLLGRMLIVGPVLILVIFVLSWPSLGLGLLMLGATLTIGGVALAIYFGRVRVDAEGDTLRVRGPFLTRSWIRHDIAAVVFVPLPGPPGPVRPATLYAVSRLNERLFWLSGTFWEREALDEVSAAIGAPVHEVPPGLPAREIQERYPGTVGWTSVRPWLLALVLAASAGVAMFLVLVITTLVLIATGELQLPAAG